MVPRAKPSHLSDTEVATPSGTLIGFAIVALVAGLTGFALGALLF